MVSSFAPFADELVKIAGLLDKHRVAYHFSDRSKGNRWKKFSKRVKSKSFVDELAKHPEADEKLVRHAKALHSLHKGRTVAKVPSEQGGGKTYEIRALDEGKHPGYGCTCGDWRYNRSVQLDPGRDCKHIRVFRRGGDMRKTALVGPPPSVGASPSFTQMCSSFFDELSKIKDNERQDREKDLDTHYDRPFSSLLTQDEEPTEEPNPNSFDLEEPEVVVRSGA